MPCPRTTFAPSRPSAWLARAPRSYRAPRFGHPRPDRPGIGAIAEDDGASVFDPRDVGPGRSDVRESDQRLRRSYRRGGANGYRPYGTYAAERGAQVYMIAPSAKIISIDSDD